MRSAKHDRVSHGKDEQRTLAIDVGGTGLKASVLAHAGHMLVKRVRIRTPYPCHPKVFLRAIAELTTPLPAFDRISVGFPGVIRRGLVITAPHFGTKVWHDYPLEATLAHLLGKPARLLNDAEVQGLGIIAGRGLEIVLTLGTGVGSAVFIDGKLAPHLELAHHPIHKDKTYNDYIGNEARRSVGSKKWNHRLRKTIDIVYTLLHYDVLYLGGGNATKIVGDLPENVKIASNDCGITGGIHLWDANVWQAVQGPPNRALQPANSRARGTRTSKRGRSRSSSGRAKATP